MDCVAPTDNLNYGILLIFYFPTFYDTMILYDIEVNNIRHSSFQEQIDPMQ